MALGCTGPRERVLATCTDPRGVADATLVEPDGQWQDQFVVIRFTQPQTRNVLFSSRQIGFAAGRVDGLAWAQDGHLLLLASDGRVRVVYDVEAKQVAQSIEFGAPAPNINQTKTCLPPALSAPGK